AGNHTEKRCLASAMRSDKANLRTTVQGGGSFDKENTVAVGLADIADAEHVRGRPWDNLASLSHGLPALSRGAMAVETILCLWNVVQPLFGGEFFLGELLGCSKLLRCD